MVPSLTLKVAAAGAVTAWGPGRVSIEGEVVQSGPLTVNSAELLGVVAWPLVSTARYSLPDSLVAWGSAEAFQPWCPWGLRL